MNSTRVGVTCDPPYSWYSSESDGLWYHGKYANVLKTLLPIIQSENSAVELVTDFPAGSLNSTLLPSILALSYESADVDLQSYAVKHERFQHIDYFQPLEVRCFYIVNQVTLRIQHPSCRVSQYT